MYHHIVQNRKSSGPSNTEPAYQVSPHQLKELEEKQAQILAFRPTVFSVGRMYGGKGSQVSLSMACH